MPVSCARVSSTYILIAGAWHGAWCWQHKLIPLLEQAGARVIAPDLPSTGADPTPAGSITLEDWARFVAGIVERHPGCALVGHSRAGAVISRVAELAPDPIRRLVYLAAYLLPPGHSVADEARRDTGSLIAPNMVPVRRGLSCMLRADVLREAFDGECPD